MVPGLELAAGYLSAWVVRKARRVGAKTDGEVDRVLDVWLARLHDLVTANLVDDPALAQLEREATTGIDSERTRRRVQDAVDQAAEDDPGFAEQVLQILDELAKAGSGRPDQHAVHTGPAIQSNVDGVAVVNTGTVGGSVHVSGSGG
jgi:hypothetical protein